MTEIADEEVDRALKGEKERADSIYADGGFIGDIQMPGPQRLDRYWLVTPNLADLAGLSDPNWEDRIRAGFDPPPVNPYWMNLLREPGLLKKTSQDFMRLNAQYEGRYEQ